MVVHSVITINDHGTILSANYHCGELFGYQASELLGQNVSVLMPNPYRDAHDHFLTRYRKTQKPHIIGVSRLVDGLRKDGSIVPVRLAVSMVKNNDETLFVGLIERAEDQRARCTINEKGVITAVNRKMSVMFGYDTPELVGHKVNKLMPKMYADVHDSFIERYMKTGKARAIGLLRNLEGRRKDGHVFPLTLDLSEEKLPSGQRIFTGVLDDMESVEQLSLITVGVDLVVRSCNKTCVFMLGYKNATDPAEDVGDDAAAAMAAATADAEGRVLVGKHLRDLLPVLDIEKTKSCKGRVQSVAQHTDGSSVDVFVELEEFERNDEPLMLLKLSRTAQMFKQMGKNGNLLDNLGEFVGNYRVGKLLGTGTFGQVVLATHRLTGKLVAIKVMDHKGTASSPQGEQLKREIDIHKECHHRNIAQLFEVLESPNKTFMVMEFVPGGELYDFITQDAVYGLEEKEARKYFRDILSAIAYLHDKNIIHRDLKLENLLLDHNGNVKIIDFGLSNHVAKAPRMMTLCGSPMYASPEMYLGTNYKGPEVDVWSLGIILYAFVFGTLPFQTPESVLNGKLVFPQPISAPCQDVLVKMLQRSARKRIATDALCQHPWVSPTAADYKELKGRARPPIILDDDIVFEMSLAGFAPKAVQASVRNNAFNQITATYKFLLEASGRRQLHDGKGTDVDRKARLHQRKKSSGYMCPHCLEGLDDFLISDINLLKHMLGVFPAAQIDEKLRALMLSLPDLVTRAHVAELMTPEGNECISRDASDTSVLSADSAASGTSANLRAEFLRPQLARSVIHEALRQIGEQLKAVVPVAVMASKAATTAAAAAAAASPADSNLMSLGDDSGGGGESAASCTSLGASQVS